MSTNYRVTLVKLSADARSADARGGWIERANVSSDDLRGLLRNFAELDPIEAAAAEPEIRIGSQGASWLVTPGQKKLLLYDAMNREAAGHSLAADEAMAEIDGTASAARVERYRATAPFPLRPPPPPEPVAPPSSQRRVRALAGIVGLLLLGAIGLRVVDDDAGDAGDFRPLPAAEGRARLEAMTGVYLVGSQPGQHGMVIEAGGDVRLFEFRAVDAPRVVHAKGVLGQTGGRFCLRLDQPGGCVAVRDAAVLEYCGETYRRLR